MKSFLKTHHKHLAIWLIIILIFCVYAPALSHQFVSMDDRERVLNNPQVRSLSPTNIASIFSSVIQDTYMPLTIFSFALEYHTVKFNPFLYHLDNILLHLAVIFLIFLLGLALGLGETGALIAAFIFGLHPMHVEPVAWISERKGVLYSVFYLGAILAYLKFLKTRNKNHYLFSLLLSLLSILAKPMAVSLPLILLLCDWFKKGKLKKEDWLNKIPYTLLIMSLGAITFVQSAQVLGQNLNANSLFRFWAFAFYLKKFFWPTVLIPHYVPPMPVDLWHFEYWSCIVLTAITAAAFIASPNKWLRLALAWFFLSVFFLLNFDYPRFTQTVADRYMYLPSAGICFWIGHIFEKTHQRNTILIIIRNFGIIVISVFLVLKSFSQIGIWKNSLSLWDFTVKHSPHSFWAYNNRGKIYTELKQFEKGLADYKESIRINPYYAKSYINLAFYYQDQGNIPAAIENFSQAILINPKSQLAFTRRGMLYDKQGNTAAALADFDEAIKIDPTYALAYKSRGMLFFEKKQWEQAFADLTRSRQFGFSIKEEYLEHIKTQLTTISQNPKQESEDPEFFNSRGQIYAMRGDLNRALSDFLKTIELKPNSDEAQNNAGIVYLMKNDPAKALSHFENALTINPNNAQANYNLGEYYYQKGNLNRSLDYLQKVLQLDPHSAAAYNKRGLIYGIEKKWDLALSNLDTALSINPRLEEAYRYRGIVLEHKKMFPEALQNYNLAITLNPKMADAYYGRGNVSVQMKNYKQAQKDFEKALAIDPRHIRARRAKNALSKLKIQP